MTTEGNGRPPVIPVGEEPPPMDDTPSASPSTGRHRAGADRGKAKGKTAGARGKAGERFAVLNAFVDFTLADLSRGEVAVWLVLYRDTRDGTARTSYDDIARRAGLNRRNVSGLSGGWNSGDWSRLSTGADWGGECPATVSEGCRKTPDLGTLAPLCPGDAGAPMPGDISSHFLGTLAPPIP